MYGTVPVAPDWPALAWAGVLSGGEQARLGGHAAGHLHGLVADVPLPIEVLVPATGPYRARGPWRFTRERPGTRSGRSVGSPPRLPVEDRDNRFLLEGLATLPYVWFDVVDHPCLVAARVAQVLLAQGWLGVPRRCRRCAAAPEVELWQSA